MLSYLSKQFFPTSRRIILYKLHSDLSHITKNKYLPQTHIFSPLSISRFTTKDKVKEDTEPINEKESETQKKEEKPKQSIDEEVPLSKYTEMKHNYRDIVVKAEQYKTKLDELTRILEENLQEKELIKGRLEKENVNAKHYAVTKLAKDILDVCDNFERAIKSAQEKDFKTIDDVEKKEIYTSFVEGVEMTQKVFGNTLVKHGIIEFPPVTGEKSDKSKHDAVDSSTGFMFNGKILRDAKVDISDNF